MHKEECALFKAARVQPGVSWSWVVWWQFFLIVFHIPACLSLFCACLIFCSACFCAARGDLHATQSS